MSRAKKTIELWFPVSLLICLYERRDGAVGPDQDSGKQHGENAHTDAGKPKRPFHPNARLA